MFIHVVEIDAIFYLDNILTLALHFFETSMLIFPLNCADGIAFQVKGGRAGKVVVDEIVLYFKDH